jgi:hypothetical protein
MLDGCVKNVLVLPMMNVAEVEREDRCRRGFSYIGPLQRPCR